MSGLRPFWAFVPILCRLFALPRIFARFYRADKARTAGVAHGFGLGLTLARRVAEVHGGAIRVEPARAEAPIGCRVTIDLPLRG